MVSALGAVAPRSFAQARAAKLCMLAPVALQRSVYAPSIVQRFAELGYRKVEYRSSDGRPERYPKQARELIELGCDLLISVGAEAPMRVLQSLQPRAPILFLAVDYDPLEQGFVSNLRRPDRNTTGVYVPQNALVAKRIEILRELLPRAKRLIVFADSFSEDQMNTAREAASGAQFELTFARFSAQPYDYAGVLQTARTSNVDAFMNLASPVFARDGQLIANELLRKRIPSIGSNPVQAEAGFLLSLGTNVAKVTRRVAELGVRLLTGTKAVEIPVEQADEFELVINAKTAAALGVKIPESVLARATRIVQ